MRTILLRGKFQNEEKIIIWIYEKKKSVAKQKSAKQVKFYE